MEKEKELFYDAQEEDCRKEMASASKQMKIIPVICIVAGVAVFCMGSVIGYVCCGVVGIGSVVALGVVYQKNKTRLERLQRERLSLGK